MLLLALVLSAFAMVDLNAAGETELASLPGIGPSKARAILEYRSAHGGFHSLDELDDIPGIGPPTIANLRGIVSVGPVPTAPAAELETTAVAPIAAATGTTVLVDINSADELALGELPGIRTAQAQAIVAYRTEKGRFTSCEGLLEVSGIGPATLAGLQDHCTAR